jgi:ribose 5-phosphate isomerase B
MKIAIGTDHRGFLHKEYIKTTFNNHEWVDVGTYNQERTDYPIYAHKVMMLMQESAVECGVLLCSTGIGMAIAANRYKHIYAAVIWNKEVALQAKAEDDINVLVLPSDFVSCEESVVIVTTWLSTEFKGGRYAQRLKMIDK